MHICVVEERKLVHADSGPLGCVNRLRSVPTMVAGQEYDDMSVTERLFGKAQRGFQQISLTKQTKFTHKVILLHKH